MFLLAPRTDAVGPTETARRRLRRAPMVQKSSRTPAAKPAKAMLSAAGRSSAAVFEIARRTCAAPRVRAHIAGLPRRRGAGLQTSRCCSPAPASSASRPPAGARCPAAGERISRLIDDALDRGLPRSPSDDRAAAPGEIASSLRASRDVSSHREAQRSEAISSLAYPSARVVGDRRLSEGSAAAEARPPDPATACEAGGEARQPAMSRPAGETPSGARPPALAQPRSRRSDTQGRCSVGARRNAAGPR